MKRILTSVVVMSLYSNEFNAKLGKYIEEFQNNGNEIDVQYSPVGDYHSALILVYEKGEHI